MHFICLHGLQFPKRKLTIYIPAKEKDEWVCSATGKKRRKKKAAYFNYVEKLLKQVHPDFSGCSWILDALRVLEDWQLEWVSLEAVRLSLYNHRRTITTKEILKAVKQRCSQKSLGINEVDLHGSVVEMIALVQKQKIGSFGGLS
ncbi:histone H2A.N-like [Bos javanicus]|uniref:histone H2A.N-like n=1 Tax=Bos javanicus TaxID=9906 RepID=UPI002AA85B0C|nr:histone H2A.N-like [Bos javanicus]